MTASRVVFTLRFPLSWVWMFLNFSLLDIVWAFSCVSDRLARSLLCCRRWSLRAGGRLSSFFFPGVARSSKYCCLSVSPLCWRHCLYRAPVGRHLGPSHPLPNPSRSPCPRSSSCFFAYYACSTSSQVRPRHPRYVQDQSVPYPFSSYHWTCRATDCLSWDVLKYYSLCILKLI